VLHVVGKLGLADLVNFLDVAADFGRQLFHVLIGFDVDDDFDVQIDAGHPSKLPHRKVVAMRHEIGIGARAEFVKIHALPFALWSDALRIEPVHDPVQQEA
jgi:hypothetical protein